MASDVSTTTAAPVSRDLNSGWLDSQGATTDGYDSLNPGNQITSTIDSTLDGTATTEADVASTAAVPQRGLASGTADVRSYKERRGEFGSSTDQFDNFAGGGETQATTTSASSSMLEASWDLGEEDTTTDESTATTEEAPTTWTDQNYSPDSNTYSIDSGKYK